jgi:hypothetical protein
LESRLKAKVRQHVTQYCAEEEIESEFRQEWERLGDFLRGRGDVEKVLAEAYSHIDPQELAHRRDRSITKTLTSVTAIRPAPPEQPR